MDGFVPHPKETASQTAGPYVHIGLAPEQVGIDVYDRKIGNVLVAPETAGERITIEGKVIDGSGTPVRDALVEIWQANAAGRYRHPVDDRESAAIDPTFRGLGRAVADFRTGLYTFQTIKPGRVPARDGREMAPHILFWIVARGINIGLATRMYFSDETAANAEDPVINMIEWEVRRQTLIAERQDRDGQAVYRFDIRLQGEHETVFFDV